MSDSFINKLNESTTVKATDVTAFDISDSSTGRYYTKKVTYHISIFSENELKH